MRKVLIVESDEAAGEDLAQIVAASGDVPVVWSPEQILPVLLIDLNPHLVIIYRKLFLKNRQLFFEGSSRLSNARIIITSAAFLDENRLRELGGDYFLRKPANSEDLKTILTRSQLLHEKVWK